MLNQTGMLINLLLELDIMERFYKRLSQSVETSSSLIKALRWPHYPHHPKRLPFVRRETLCFFFVTLVPSLPSSSCRCLQSPRDTTRRELHRCSSAAAGNPSQPRPTLRCCSSASPSQSTTNSKPASLCHSGEPAITDDLSPATSGEHAQQLDEVLAPLTTCSSEFSSSQQHVVVSKPHVEPSLSGELQQIPATKIS
ncbi:CTP synthase 1 [Striga asiatica]|uniref:CTP synthase 1 n=1 Tax=Striga asiatica TaxID=4170 RepID=A0A5A7PD78_STRAF|nr:CTP synthase 1 [Striga asiatica]